ncbi:MAG: tRNA (guanosine(37)-N1)-methyltransferase TrmD [Anaerolineae bacterium]|nr:tRNA (guanosine(37)-N1)-methyltransferase TrmD [Anaerolineae bacterium]MDW8300273.1 tRNA (guanosine(37)-N1)-methyltransferase TrmD [Anaerolineae bacterium]
MRFEIFTLFPAMFESVLRESILKRARERGLLTVNLHNIRAYATDKHQTTDEPPYGGGGGMVLKVEPIVRAVESVLAGDSAPVILTTPQGERFTQRMAAEFATYPRLAIICGRYEGVDERVRQLVVTHEVSIGDYVLSGGELAAMVMLDAIARHIPNVLGNAESAPNDSFSSGLLEGAHYTRPPEFRGLCVPEVLLSGDHAAVARWRRRSALQRTWQRRPELLLNASLSESERYFLGELADAWSRGES